VIASNSVFTYKGKPVKIVQRAREQHLAVRGRGTGARAIVV
jgi:TolB-like protein